MKCIFCSQTAGFFKSYHDECFNRVKETLAQIESIINDHNKNKIDTKEAKKELRELVLTDKLYQNYLKHNITDMTAIRANETIIYAVPGMNISESKNFCKMIQTGHRYEKKPVWKEENHVVGNDATVVITDIAFYMILLNRTVRYPYNNIVNLGYDDKWGYVYFDIRTSSAYPHRFIIRADNKKEKKETENICLFISCFIRHKEK